MFLRLVIKQIHAARGAVTQPRLLNPRPAVFLQQGATGVSPYALLSVVTVQVIKSPGSEGPAKGAYTLTLK